MEATMRGMEMRLHGLRLMVVLGLAATSASAQRVWMHVPMVDGDGNALGRSSEANSTPATWDLVDNRAQVGVPTPCGKAYEVPTGLAWADHWLSDDNSVEIRRGIFTTNGEVITLYETSPPSNGP